MVLVLGTGGPKFLSSGNWAKNTSKTYSRDKKKRKEGRKPLDLIKGGNSNFLAQGLLIRVLTVVGAQSITVR